MLNDSNAEVQNLVVRCLGLCASIIGNDRLKSVLDSLCKSMGNNEEMIRDAASMAITHAVKDFRSEKVNYAILVDILMPRFVNILRKYYALIVFNNILSF